ncbi:uncharacterized protein TRIVIDRAFT_60653 [Trichoderma virens Gv29-8]|uniref:Uncharacterized protein n=1 Tax=Hypocrea virens (strain Gv29-8 / FGSC 10586) TaxID=413071 RepID=G9MQW4_HYPVG|nr:uncharacterized protein TRIVIDRAFT_60653 [Trichoderma virens Gv29-8]EHK22493.1 hypothetical protein TRIVIDRAFT_60653 [Trichoderma virens Gv29-8]
MSLSLSLSLGLSLLFLLLLGIRGVVRRWRLDYGVQRGTGHSFVLSKYSLRSQLTRSTDGAGAYPKGRPTRRTAISTAYVRFYRGAWYRPPSNVKRTGPTGDEEALNPMKEVSPYLSSYTPLAFTGNLCNRLSIKFNN